MSTAELFVHEPAARLELRPLQAATLQKVREAWIGGAKNVLVQAPCGFGKTELATAMLLATHEKGKHGMFVCDRLSLVEQTSQRFDKYGLPHGIVQGANERFQPWQKTQLCSVQTLTSRGEWPESDLLVVDEAHVLHGGVKRKLARRDCRAIGLTATPFARGLGRYFDALVNAATTNELIAAGLLTPFRGFAPSEPDMEGVRVKRSGEYAEDEAQARVLPIVGDCVAEYLKRGEGRKFIVFAVNVAHAEELKRQFAEAGIVTDLYTYKQGDEPRKGMIEEFRKPDSYIRGLISIEALTRGFDVADVGVLILARPLRNSLAVLVQMLGRVLRTAEGKEEAVVLDHAGNLLRFWGDLQRYLAEGWHELDDGKPKEKKPSEAPAKEPMKCPRCAYVHDPRPMCPACGHEYPRRSSEVTHVAGELSELTGLPAGGGADQQAIYAQLLGLARQRGKDRMWARCRFKDRFDHWPSPNLRDYEEPPSEELKRWVTSQTIRYLKGRGKRGGR